METKIDKTRADTRWLKFVVYQEIIVPQAMFNPKKAYLLK